jgi:hypothetical protein
VTEAIAVLAIFAIVCRLYQWYTGQSVFKKRPRWNAQEEAVLESQQFSSYRNRSVTHSDYEAQPFALDAGHTPRRAEMRGFVQDRKAEWLGGYPW